MKWRSATATELIRVARKLGFEKDRQKGSHVILLRHSDNARVVIPLHKGKHLKTKTLAGIIHDLGLTPQEFEKLL